MKQRQCNNQLRRKNKENLMKKKKKKLCLRVSFMLLVSFAQFVLQNASRLPYFQANLRCTHHKELFYPAAQLEF